MNGRETARILGLVRLGLGVVSFVLPKTTMKMWIGQEAKPYPTNMVLRGMAARDIALGIGLLAALENDGQVRGWLEGGAAADLGDAIGTLSVWRDLPGLRRLLLLSSELGAVALQIQLVSELD
ncbi:MAG: hypothetical protein M3280_01300 [Actinomycetota bacterium]|nr:hypothetical protein [Actinomycetota bacterium]